MDGTKIITCLITAACLIAGNAACSRPHGIVVGSKNFTEQALLGEMLAQQIERRLAVSVDRKFNLGGTLLAHEALVKGGIDLYPEYSGTALSAVLKRAPIVDRVASLEAVRSAYEQQWHLRWLSPFGFNNTFAMIVRGEMARAFHLSTLSDAARARTWKIGAGYEFRERADGLNGPLKTYGLRTDGDPVTMDLGLLYAALEGRNVDMIAANSTDGQIARFDVAVLRDDKHYFPPYECAVVVRDEILSRYPKLRAALEELSGKLSDELMRKLNYAVDGQHRAPAEVAAEFLKSF